MAEDDHPDSGINIFAPVGLLERAVESPAHLAASFFGATPERLGRQRDLGTLELFSAAALTTLIVLLGVLPAILMDSINFSVLSLLSRGSG